MKMEFKTLSKLSLLVPVLMALSSCSSMGNMQGMHKAVGQSVHVTKQRPQVIPQHHSIMQVKQHHQQLSQVPEPQQLSSVSIEKTKPIVQPKISQPKPVAAPSVARHAIISSENPVVGALYLLNVHGIAIQSRLYVPTNNKSLIYTLHGRDLRTGNYHYIRVNRWDGTHIDTAYINVRTAALLFIIGQKMLENGYFDTGFGKTIVVFGGNCYFHEIPGHQFDLIMSVAGGKMPVKKVVPIKGHQLKPVKAKQKNAVLQHNMKMHKTHIAKFDPSDFYIQGTKVITVTSKHLHYKNKVTQKHILASKGQVTHKYAAVKKPAQAVKINVSRQYCNIDNAIIKTRLHGSVEHNILCHTFNKCREEAQFHRTGISSPTAFLNHNTSGLHN